MRFFLVMLIVIFFGVMMWYEGHNYHPPSPHSCAVCKNECVESGISPAHNCTVYGDACLIGTGAIKIPIDTANTAGTIAPGIKNIDWSRNLARYGGAATTGADTTFNTKGISCEKPCCAVRSSVH